MGSLVEDMKKSGIVTYLKHLDDKGETYHADPRVQRERVYPGGDNFDRCYDVCQGDVRGGREGSVRAGFPLRIVRES